MPYFIILPAFALYLLAAGVALAVTYFYAPAASFRPYATALLIWPSAGFIVSSAIYAVVMIGLLAAIARADHATSFIWGAATAGLVFVGPFAAAAFGLLAGAVVGLRRVRGACSSTEVPFRK
jgi:hypothetical protein